MGFTARIKSCKLCRVLNKYVGIKRICSFQPKTSQSLNELKNPTPFIQTDNDPCNENSTHRQMFLYKKSVTSRRNQTHPN